MDAQRSGFRGFIDSHWRNHGETFAGEDWGQWDPDDPMYRIFPEPDGLLSWGSNHTGDVFWWHTEGEPDHWPVILWARGPVRTFRFDCGMVDFLNAMLSGDPSLPEGLRFDVRSNPPQWTRTADWLHR